MQEQIEKLILLGNKAKILTGITNTSEPRVGVLFTNSGEVFVTFNSSCFPFFSENGFETVKYEELETFIEKCDIYVKNLEKNISFTKNNKNTSGIPPILCKNKSGNNLSKSSFLYYTKNGKFRITTTVCEDHKNDIKNTFKPKKDTACRKVGIKVEELEN